MIDNILGDRHKPRRKINSTLEFPLSGKLYCAKCGAPMAGTSGTSCTGATYHYYKCRKCRRTPEVILGTFVRFVEIDGKTLNVYFAFDRYGDDFRPKQKKAEPCPEGHSSTNSLVVELMRKTANSTSTANRAAIQLDTCIVRVSKNWFVVVGTCQK